MNSSSLLSKLSGHVGLLSLALLAAPLQAGPPVLLKDIYPGFGSFGSNPTEITVVGDDLYFLASGRLHRTSGTTGETKVAAGSLAGAASQFAAAGSRLAFVLSGTQTSGFTNPQELYMSDGSATGTLRKVGLLDPASFSLGSSYYGTPYRLASMGNSAYYIVDYPNLNSATTLYRADGSSGEVWTIQLSGFVENFEGTNFSSTVVSGQLYIAAHSSTGCRLFKTNGSRPGTMRVKNLSLNSGGSMAPQSLVALGSTVFFHAKDTVNGDELWKSDGTDAGTVMVADIRPGSAGSMTSLPSAAAMGGYIYFAADDGVNGAELWRSDGTPGGTSLVKDINVGAAASSPGSFTVVGSTLYFTAVTAASGRELWRSDGTEAGTQMIAEIASGTASGLGTAPAMASFGGLLYFTANDGTNGEELWRTDGTPGGTIVVQDIRAGAVGSAPASLLVFDDQLHFTADNGLIGRELWKTNGVSSPVAMDLAGENSGNPSTKALLGNVTLFTATDEDGEELWKTDGTSTGTVKVKDIASGPSSSSPDRFHMIGSKALFRAFTPDNGSELWVTDGSETGTMMLADMIPGSNSSDPFVVTTIGQQVILSSSAGLWRSDGTPGGTYQLTTGSISSSSSKRAVVGSTFFFALSDGTHGEELWKTDGTVAGTGLVKDIRPGSSGSSLNLFTAHNGVLYFRAGDSNTNTELWKSDGTTTGTVMVKDIWEGTSGSAPEKLHSGGGKLFFTAATSASGRELWTTDGTSGGTVMVVELTPGTASTGFGSFFNFNGNVFFWGSNPIYGGEYWTTDGTPVGTHPVKDIRPGSSGSNPNYLSIQSDAFYFEANDGTHGAELWKSDGTEVGTVLVKDIEPNQTNSSSQPQFAAGAYLYFKVFKNGDYQLWRTDGTDAGTVPITDLETGNVLLAPGGSVIGTSVYFSRTSILRGSEMWVIEQGSPHARPVTDIYQGIGSSTPLVSLGPDGKFLLSAFAPGIGRELYLSDPSQQNRPYATTRPASAIGSTTASLAGLVLPGGQPMTAVFEFGTSLELGTTIPVTLSPADGTEPQLVSHALSGLMPGTTYFYQLGGTNAAGTDQGGIQSFRTISDNAALASFAVGTVGIDASINPEIFHYEVAVSAGASTVGLNAESVDPNAMVSINGQGPLKRYISRVITVHPGLTEVSVEVTSADASATRTYTVTITRPSAPEIALSWNGVNLADGDSTPSTIDGTDHGSVGIGSSSTRLFIITNHGNEPLTISPPVIAGTHAGDFSVSAMPSDTVAGGGTTTLGITFTPTATGTRNATISFANNDGDENPFNFSIRGTGVIPPLITFPEIPNRIGTLEPVVLGATANNGQAIQYEILSGSAVATLTGGTISLTGEAGSVTVVARQAEGGGFLPAPPVYRTFVVSAASPFVSFAPGGTGSSNLGLRADGTLWAWGNNDLGGLGLGFSGDISTPQQVGASTTWQSLSKGEGHVVALQSNGTIWTWGAGFNGQLGGGTTPFSQSSPQQMGVDTNWQSVAAGSSYSLAIKTNGTLWAWGSNFDGQLGDGTTTQRTAPVQIGSDNTWAAVSAGRAISMGLKTNGTLWTWGGVPGTASTPIQVGSESNWIKISAGRTHRMALKNDGTLWGWGENESGQLGDGTTIAKGSPVQIGGDTDWSSVSAGGLFTLALKTDGSLWTWGSSPNGELGIAGLDASLVPVPITSAGSEWQSIVANHSHGIGIKTDGSAWAWGRGLDGQLASISTPVAISMAGEASGLAVLSTGQSHSTAIGQDGRLWTWGSNSHGQLGDNTNNRRLQPLPIGLETNWAMVAAGRVHNLAIKTDGTLWGWGDNATGQFGNGSTTGSLVPMQIGTDTDWQSVSTSGTHTLAIKTNGTLWAWGDNTYGQLGDGTLVASLLPVQVGTATTWESASAGSSFQSSHSLARMSNGTLWAWGRNNDGQLGLGNTTQRTSPVQIGTATDWQLIRAGGSHGVALKTNGELWAWGRGNSGQIGDAASLRRTSPVQVGIGTTWVDVTAGSAHTFGMAADGTLFAWGSNGFGQLGDGTDVNRASPVLVGTNGKWSMPISGGESSHTLALRGNRLWGIGNNSAGQVPGADWGRFSPRISVPGRAPQTVEFPLVIANIGEPVALQATAASGLPVQYAVTGPATLNGHVLTVHGPEEVRVDAWQAGDDSAWLPSQPVMLILNDGIVIPDSNLLAALRVALGKPSGAITEADMLTLTHLNLANTGITDLSGLEAALNLRILDIRGNPFADAAATWAILDQLSLYCLYADLPRPGGTPPGLLTQSVTTTNGGTFYITVDAINLPTLDISGLGIDTSNPANLDALDVFADAGVTVDTGANNLPPAAVGTAAVTNEATGATTLDGSASRDIDGTVVAWAWTWAGGSANGSNPSASFPLGTTSVTLTVTDDDGATGATTVEVVVQGAPEIAVEYPLDTELTGGSSTITFLPRLVGSAGESRVVTIRNAGTAVLQDITVAVAPAGTDFSLDLTGTAGSLVPGATTTFSILFTPSETGPRTASLMVASNDGDENPTAIGLAGVGLAPEWFWTNLSGQAGGWGNADGTGAAARFDSPGGIVSDNNGGFFVADSNNHVIRRVSPAGVVTPFAGSTQMFGSSDGTGSAASFRGPTGMAMKQDGFLVVADTQNSVIRQISPSGEVTLVAGSPGAAGSQSGTGSGARFFLPRAVAVDQQMNIYVADSNNHIIRKIDITGEVTLFAGAPGQVGGVNGPKLNARFNNPRGIAVDPGGMVYVAEWGSHTLRRIDPTGSVTTLAGVAGASGSTDGSGPGARFNRPSGIAFDTNGNLLVADTDNHLIRLVTPGGTVSTLAGSPLVAGDADGIGSMARFGSPLAVHADSEGIHVADSANSMVRKINSAMEVTTLAGTSPQSGITNGDLASARYRQPGGGVFDAAGNLYIADTGSHNIRIIQPDGTVSVFAGGGVSGFANGLGTVARFNQPTEIVLDPLGNLLVSDKGNNRIRKITLAGEVTTHAGTGQSGSTDGTALTARFLNPHGMVFDSQGNLFITDFLANIIRKLDANGNVTTFAGAAGQNGSTDGTGAAARFIQPAGLAIDPSDNLYVANSGGHTIRKITPAGEVTTLAGSNGIWGGTDGTGSGARFWSPRPIVWHPDGYLIAGDWLGHTIRRIDPSGEVTTIGGLSGAGTDFDGFGPESRFSRPAGIVIGANHSLLVMDSYNNRIVSGSLPTPPGLAFADPLLEAAIRTALAKPTGAISSADLLTITNLNLANLGITDLSGLEAASNLHILNIRGNPFADAVATWTILDQLPLYCLYSDLPRPGGNSPGLITQAVTDTNAQTFYIVVDAENLPTLDVTGLGIDTNNPDNITALDNIAAAGVNVVGAENTPPTADASYTILDAIARTVSLNGSASVDPDGSITTYAWSWNGGGADGVNPTIVFAFGETSVTLTVTDNRGGTASTTLEVVVPEPPGGMAQVAYVKASNTGTNDGFGGAFVGTTLPVTGKAVAVSGNIMVIGAPDEDSNASTVNGNQSSNTLANAGAAYVFVRASDGTWSQQAYLKPSDPATEEKFGWSVAVSGDTIVIGAPWGRGRAYVFQRNGTTWTQQALLPYPGSLFGFAVAVEGDTALVGAPSDFHGGGEKGAVLVYGRTGTVWAQTQKLVSPVPGTDDNFGFSLAFAADTAVIGVPGEDSNSVQVNQGGTDNSASNSGAAHVFQRTSGTWSHQSYLKPLNTGSEDYFGWSVGIAGGSVVIGSPYEDGSGAGVDMPSNDGRPDSGAAYVFTQSGGVWAQGAYLKSGNPSETDYFGLSVSASGKGILVGAIGENSGATGVNAPPAGFVEDSGAAYVFSREGSQWSQLAYLKASNRSAEDFFGFGVALSGTTAVVSAFGEDSSATGVGGSQGSDASSQSGAAYVFHLGPLGGATGGNISLTSALAAAGLSGEDAGFDAIPFDDGVENLLKYAFNMNLAGPDSSAMEAGGNSGLPVIAPTGTGAATVLRFEYVRRTGSGLTYTPKKSSTLGPAAWTTLGDAPTVIPIDANWERVIYEEPSDPAEVPTCFGRVEVAIP